MRIEGFIGHEQGRPRRQYSIEPGREVGGHFYSGNRVRIYLSTLFSDVTGHAETNLVRIATTAVDGALMAGSTLYSSAEPCAMCAGATYWSHVGRLAYALSEADLFKIIGEDERNPTLSLPCRSVFAAGQREMTVVGPVVVPGMREVHEGFWN